LQYLREYEHRKQSMNAVVSKPRLQVSAQNTCCGECTLKLQVLTSDSCRLALGSDLSCHYCYKVAVLSWPHWPCLVPCLLTRQRTCRKRALVSRGLITTPGGWNFLGFASGAPWVASLQHTESSSVLNAQTIIQKLDPSDLLSSRWRRRLWRSRSRDQNHDSKVQGKDQYSDCEN